jgi:hypothetical protein
MYDTDVNSDGVVFGVWLGRAVWFALGAIVGALFSAYFMQWYIARVPGPKAFVEIGGLKATRGNAAGCKAYYVSMNSDGPIDYSYWKIQFPRRIADAKVSFAREARGQSGERSAVQSWAVSKDPDGRFIIKGPGENTGSVQFSSAGNMLSVEAQKLSLGSVISGMVVIPTDGESAINPAPADLTFEGAYEYTKLGQAVRKPLTFVNRGMSETK